MHSDMVAKSFILTFKSRALESCSVVLLSRDCQIVRDKIKKMAAPRHHTNGVQLEKGLDHNDGYEVNSNGFEETPEAVLYRIRTAGCISISPELFEKLYLTLKNAVKGDLRKTFGNPYPL